MPVVQKRMRKYFGEVEGRNSPMYEDRLHNYDLLRTIKLQKNIFKLNLPNSTYAPVQNYATVPAPQIPRKPKEERNRKV